MALAHWDVFHSDRLETERSLTTEAVRAALGRGDLGGEDLVRPAGSSSWARIGDSPEFAGLDADAFGAGEFAPPTVDPDEDDPAESDLARFEVAPGPSAAIDPGPPAFAPFEPPTEFEVVVEDDEDEPGAGSPVLAEEEAGRPDLPELDGPDFADEAGEPDPQDEDDEAAGFTLSRNSAERVEELDLAAMVDVAFQLVLFFLVTASTVVFKTLEVPRPNEDKPPEAAAQARSQSVDELEKDYILVEVDAAGAVKVDRQPITANRAALVERLRSSRESTQRKAMLLSADFATPHKNAVLVFDVANEIDLRIAIAQPQAKK